jgi:AraC family transcriptional regulator of adaptative response / DNA-3-methyladenine glycosylase II
MNLVNMDLDCRICSRARLSRDARFDGKFFVGVLTTGIYCRPICRSPTAQEKNVRYFATAAEAAAAGLRPCLRCRPECAPGTPAWMGTRTTVARALRLIGETGLEEGGIEALASRLGVGSRHLRRLFLKHLGATPKAVADTRRLHFAKKLIDETSLPMTQVALASGFGCVRRFNAGIRKVYGRTPSQIRQLSRQTVPKQQNRYVLEFLAARAVLGVEVVAENVYRRSIELNGIAGHFEVSQDEVNSSLIVHLQFGEPRSLFFVIERIRALFDLNADWSAIVTTLKADRALVGSVEANPGLRVPGCWSGFELTVRAILEHQTTLEETASWTANLVRAFGQPLDAEGGITHLFPSPEVLADANFKGIGLPAERATAIRSLARAVIQEEISFQGVVDTDALLTRLRKLPAFSEWTTQYVAMRAFAEPDAFPSDIALQRALELPSARELERRAEGWRPWRAYAVMYLWDPSFGKYSRPRRGARGATSDALWHERAFANS